MEFLSFEFLFVYTYSDNLMSNYNANVIYFFFIEALSRTSLGNNIVAYLQYLQITMLST